ncbi:MAG: type II 3-dehydroquinate dehydratase [Synergistaceae bacterium]
MKILVINGPNLNMLGMREPEIYGDETLEDLIDYVIDYCKPRNVEVEFYQSNHEGDIIDAIQEALDKFDGIIINPAAYTHTSIAIPDAIKAVDLPAVEVHLSDINSREEFRKVSFTAPVCIATVAGKGFDSYLDAVEILLAWINGA